MKKVLITIILLLLITGCSISGKTKVLSNENGLATSSLNQVVSEQSKLQPTYPIDSDFATSSDKTKIVFVRDIGDHKACLGEACLGEGYYIYNQLVIKDLSNDKENIIVQSGKFTNLKISNLPKKYPFDTIAGMGTPIFSSDDGYIYFIASAWSTSGAIFSVNLKTKEIKYITDGMSLELIKTGEFKGNLIINRRHYKQFEDGSPGIVLHCDDIIDYNNGERLKDLNKCD